MNFSRIDFARKRPLPSWILFGLVLMLGMTAWGGLRIINIQHVVTKTEAEFRKEQQQMTARVASIEPTPTIPTQQIQSVNEAIAALNVPWPALMGAIEKTRPPKIALTRIEPRPNNQRISITAQAESMDELIAFMQQLSSAAPFLETIPIRQEQLHLGGSQRMQATFEARWRKEE